MPIHRWGDYTPSGHLGRILDDETPQLGGTLDANGNTIDMGANTITDTKVGQWDTAYGWGDHGAAGYLTSYTVTESDVTAHQAALSITESQISDLGTYLTAESDTLDSVTGRGATTTNAITVGNLTSTGIDDNATSTAITIDSSQSVGIGTSPKYSLDTTKAIYSGLSTYTGTNYGDIPGYLYLNGDTSGYGVVGAINSTQKFLLSGGSNTVGFLTYDTTGLYIQSDEARADFGVTQGEIAFKTGASFIERMSISSGGTVTISNGSGSGSNGNLTLTASASGNEGGQINFNTVSSGTYSIDTHTDNMRFLNGTTSGDYFWYKNSNAAIGMTLTGAGDLEIAGGLEVGGASIGTRANSISVVGDNNSSTIASKTTSYDTVFSVLPWSSSITYLGTGTYYDDGSWIHASDNGTSSLLALSGSGVHWYASSGSVPNFDIASNVPLWNSTGQWDGDINTTYDINTGSITVGDGSSTASHIAIKPADDGTSDDLQFYNGTTRMGEIGTQDTTWLRINQSTAKNIYTPRYIRADGGFFVDGTSKGINGSGNFIGGTVTTTALTAEVASGPAIYIKDTSGTGATNHNSWLSFRDSGGTELGYVGYGSGSDSGLSLSNYNNGVVNIQGTKASVITSTGYIEIGSLNTSHAHFYTDRGSYYFNKLMYIDGSGLRGYDSSTDCRFPLYYDLNDTSYYCDPASTSRLNVSYNNETSHFADHGRGVKFWNTDSYKIYMSAISNSTWGGDVAGSNASDYAMYFRMSNGTNRGFIFRNNTTNVAKIDGNGVLSASGVFGTSTYLDVKYNASGAGGVRLYDSDSTLQGYWYGNGSGEHGFLDNDGAWAVRIRTSTNPLQLRTNNNNELMVYTSYVRAVGSCRSPIFYDMNNTSYYAHLDSTGDSIRAAGDIVAYYSDERLKNIEGPIENALDKVSTLNGFYYRGNEKAQKLGYDDKLKVGLSAQEVQKVLPEVIKSCPADNQYMTLDYSKVVPLLVEAIKELKSEIEELKK